MSPFAVETSQTATSYLAWWKQVFFCLWLRNQVSGTGNDKDTEAIASGSAKVRVLSFGGRF